MAWPVFTTPWMLAGALAGALVIGVLHLLSVRQPTVLELPTARFVPEGEARAVARQPRPNDLLLLLLRVLAVLLAGLALAGMQWPTTRATVLRLVVVDSVTARDSVFTDSLTRSLQSDSALVEVVTSRGVRYDPGAALVTATAAASRLVQQHATLERVELTTLVPPNAASWRGFRAWAALWPGHVRVFPRGGNASNDTLPMLHAVRVRATTPGADDPVSAWATAPDGVTLPGDASAAGRAVVEVLRGTRNDGEPAAASRSVVLVHWPVSGIPEGWEPRARPDTVGALVAQGEVLAGPWERVARPGAPLQARLDSARDTNAWRVIAWWSDGEPAAVEQSRADGCTRTVSLLVPRGSDALLSAPARGVREALTGPCGGPRDSWATIGRTLDSARAAGAAPAAAFRTTSGDRRGSDPQWLAPLLLGLSLAALLGEWIVRQREGSA